MNTTMLYCYFDFLCFEELVNKSVNLLKSGRFLNTGYFNFISSFECFRFLFYNENNILIVVDSENL